MKKILALVATLASVNVFAQDIDIQLEMSVGNPFSAKSSKLQGTARRSGGSVSAQKLTLDLNTLDTDIKLRNEHMIKKYFEAGKYPKAELTDVKGSGGKFTGKLALHGQTVPVEGDYKIEGAKVKAKFTTKVSDYKIAEPKYMGVGVEDEVTIEATVPIK